ncbi:MAG: Uma2 family endonuclease [Acidobacteriota bacterium]|nr:Uma2 family endonuclease [Acidobacteriota bacterium]
MSRKVKPTVNSFVPPEDYLALERKAESKSEYFDGEIHAMTGASRRHNLITLNVASELRARLRTSNCETYANDMRVKVSSGNVYTYPDVVVVGDEPKLEDEHRDTVLNPTLLAEVLSKSTANYDRTVKFGHYRALESLAEYLLIAQDEYRVEQYTRQPGGRWLLTDIRGLESVVELTSVGCALRLAEIYERVEL